MKNITVLDHINGNEGVVSLIGKLTAENGSSQMFTQHQGASLVQNLNVLAKVFHKGPSYTSIIQDTAGTNQACTSYDLI
jgi:hypothetical protein